MSLSTGRSRARDEIASSIPVGQGSKGTPGRDVPNSITIFQVLTR
jgi:hypothetical protein